VTLKARKRDAFGAVTEEMPEKTWRENEYRLMFPGQLTDHMLKCSDVAQKNFFELR
jgi:hypothetical protein